MRFPNLTELDSEQELIYEGAPRDGTILIVGPPGTGKTVIAFHRADYLRKLGQVPRVLMYNKVLRKYASERGGLADGVDVSTIFQWISSWWRSSFNSRLPYIGSDSWSYDWLAIQVAMTSRILEGKGLNRVNWGHLLIDEGQDMPPEMYVALNFIMHLLNSQSAAAPVAITVLADDNQRLQPGKNSTVEQIRQALGLHDSDKNVFSLRQNYRNTLEVARFAASFYMGFTSGKPDLPEKRHGPLPTVFLGAGETEDINLGLFANRIANYAKMRGQEIGVFVPTNRIRKKMVNRLKLRLDNTINVQSYSSTDPDAPAESLRFDEEGYVTVLNYASAKGLEFESVFIIDPMEYSGASNGSLELKMALYVLCSRAKSGLNIMMVKEKSNAQLFDWLGPADGLYKIEGLS